MVKISGTSRAASTRLEFLDGLRGYRFANELRRRRGTALRVWHDAAIVVVEFPKPWASDDGVAALIAASGGVVAGIPA